MARHQGGNQKPVMIAAESRSLWHGPLPPPEVLESYDKALPGTMERIIALAETEAAHRRMLEERMQQEAHESRREVNAIARTGQRFAFAVTISSFLCALVAAHMQQTLVAGLFVGTTLLGVVQSFLQSGHGDKPKQ